MAMSIVAGNITPNKDHNRVFTETCSSLEEFKRRWPEGVFLHCEDGTWVQFIVYPAKNGESEQLFVEWGEPAA
jgi:hypothetical protein